MRKIDPSNPSLLPALLALFEQMGGDPELHAKVRRHRLELELAHFRHEIPRKTGMLHASQVSFGTPDSPTCERRICYSLLSHPQTRKVDPQLANIYEVGHDAHAKYQGMLSYLFPTEFTPEVGAQDSGVGIVGTCDGVLDFYQPSGRLRVGVEFKTCRDSTFPKSKPVDKHVDQATVYGFLLNLNFISIFYENKNTQEIKEFVVEPDQDRFDRITKVCQSIYQHVEGGVLPRRRPSYQECRYCPYEQDCQPRAVRNTIS